MNVEELREWLKNKEIRIWKRVMLLLCETGKPMSTREISVALGIRRSSALRTLKKIRVDHVIGNEIKNKKELWSITRTGQILVRRMQKKKLLPERDR